MRQRLVAGARDAAARQHVDLVGHDVIEQPLVVGDQQHAAIGGAQRIHAARHHLQRVDVEAGVGLVEHRERGLEHQHLQDLVALLFAAGETFVDAARQETLVHLHELHLAAHQLQEFVGVDFGLPIALRLRVDRGLEQIDVVDAGNFHRVLEPEEHAGARAFFGRHREQVAALELHAAAGDLVTGTAGEHVGERALARAVRAHDGVHFARIDACSDSPAAHSCRRPWRTGLRSSSSVAHPTAPSRLTANKFCASTANSIGNSLRTVLQKPLTIMFTASSSSMPRCRQ